MIQNDWELLITLHEEKNITKAAAKLFLTQPAVTKRLKSLEEEFSVQIVNRTPKGVIFTDEGNILVEYSKKMLKNYEDIKSELNLVKKIGEETIKIAIPNGFARKYLSQILSDFKQIYPHANFDIITGWSSNIIQKIENNEVDVAFVRGEHQSNKKSILLFDEDLLIINSEEINTNNLPNMTKIEFESDLQFDRIIDKWWKNHYSNSPKKKMKVDRSDICLKMVTQGLGYAILPASVLSGKENLIKIKIYDENNEALKRVTRLFYSEKFSKLEIGEKFINLIKNIDFK